MVLVMVLGAPLAQPTALAQALERNPRCAGQRFASPALPLLNSGFSALPDTPPAPSANKSVDPVTVAQLASALRVGLPEGCPAPSAVLLLALPAAAHALGADPVPLWQDQTLRAALAHLGWPYRLVVGQGLLRQTTAALTALGLVSPVPEAPPPATGMAAERQRLRALGCEKCSDPECEHRLFTGLTR